ncbi:hypothetical protein ACRYCC_25975 [Actinomadura scrupuli]|uniref:hypothetical protein n=1 Tax=Actinomadura scrupuli TaxID=559629 RepID=UPI003D97AA36
MQRSKPPHSSVAAELEPLMTAEEAAPYAGMPASWLLKQAYAGAIPCHRVGGRRFVRFSKQNCLEIQESSAERPISEIQPKSARA